jgi:predicted nucleic acid-binding protein
VTHATLIVSPRLLERFVQRAHEERFRRWFSVADARELADRLSDLADIVPDPEHVPAVVEEDPSDDYLVALARHARADVLLTGDHGIRRALEHADDLNVLSPAELLEELIGQPDATESEA